MLHQVPRADHDDAADLQLLNALAATQYLFGRYEKAMSLLQFAHWIDASCTKTIELVAVVAVRQGRLDQAHAAIRTLEDLGAPLPKALQAVKTHTMAA